MVGGKLPFRAHQRRNRSSSSLCVSGVSRDWVCRSEFGGAIGAFTVKILKKCLLVLPPEPGVVILSPGLTPPRVFRSLMEPF